MCKLEAAASVDALSELHETLSLAQQIFPEQSGNCEAAEKALTYAREREAATSLDIALRTFMEEDERLDPALISAVSKAFKDFSPFVPNLDKTEHTSLRKLLPQLAANAAEKLTLAFVNHDSMPEPIVHGMLNIVYELEAPSLSKKKTRRKKRTIVTCSPTPISSSAHSPTPQVGSSSIQQSRTKVG